MKSVRILNTPTPHQLILCFSVLFLHNCRIQLANDPRCISTYQSLLSWVRPNHSTEVSEICGAHFADMKKGVDTEGGEALEEEPLGHLLANQGRHLGQQLQMEVSV